jgi:hypothetical protein
VKNFNIDLSFSQRPCCRFEYSGFLSCVFG